MLSLISEENKECTESRSFITLLSVVNELNKDLEARLHGEQPSTRPAGRRHSIRSAACLRHIKHNVGITGRPQTAALSPRPHDATA